MVSDGRATMLLGVGGSPEGLIRSIDQHRPERVIFFVSPESSRMVNESIRPGSSHHWSDDRKITVRDEQDLVGCLRVLRERLPDALSAMHTRYDDLIVDYTGGTKPMSVALVLATVEKPVVYSYVGGKAREKNGIGQVISGSEVVLQSTDPWTHLAIGEQRRYAELFNAGHYHEAKLLAENVRSQATGSVAELFGQLKRLAKGFEDAACFQYDSAVADIESAGERLASRAEDKGDAALQGFTARVREEAADMRDRLAPTLKALQQGSPDFDPAAARQLVHLLVEQAHRSAREWGRPDDGVARLYSALEKLAKLELLEHGIDNSNARPDQIPDSLREDYVKKYAAEDGRLEFGLRASFELLAALETPVGRAYRKRANDLDRVLDARNSSLLVHGWQPVKQRTFDRMLDITVAFLGVQKPEPGNRPEFPADTSAG